MFRTCIFCRSDLGSNEAVEEFPVGRRLAFDPARGRLWVVCRACERWNLSPLEERWEAVERMEQLFRDTRLRVSTEQIGLARLKEGTDLVRVGAPQRPEFAAWRYGDQFGRRRRRSMIGAGLGVGALGALIAGGTAVGISLGMFGPISNFILNRFVHGSPDEVIARLERPVGDEPAEIKRKDLNDVILRGVGVAEDFRIIVPRSASATRFKGTVLQYAGDEALSVAAQILPAMNRFGGNTRTVRDAVELLEQAGDPLRTFGMAARNVKYKKLVSQSAAVRLALEMAAHEEQERRALEGELLMLEQAWREAEEIAAIADRLLVPDAVAQAFARIRTMVGA